MENRNNHTGSVVARVTKDRALQSFPLEVKNMLGKKETRLTLGEWNVRTLLDRPSQSDRPERQTALVARELDRYNIDIAALSETRFLESGALEENLGGYTFYWRGKPAGHRRDHGVGFAIRTRISRKLQQLPTPVNERLMSLRLPLDSKNHLTLISAYAPTMSYPEEEIDLFYHQLQHLVNQTPGTDKFIILGDFNARVGADSTVWSETIGKFGMGKINSNGEKLLAFCTENKLVITNTLFKTPECKKSTWMHPRSKHWHQIDFIITRQSDKSDVLSTCAMRGANCNTDHQLLRARFALVLRKSYNKHTSTKPTRLNVRALKENQTKSKLDAEITKQLQENPLPQNDINSKWTSLKDTILKTAEKVLGKTKRKNHDWFDDNDTEIQEMITAKNAAYSKLLSSKNTRSRTQEFKDASRKLQKKTREMKTKWWEDKAKELQLHADTNNMRSFYSGLKEVWGPRTNATSQLKAADGHTILTEDHQILDRWAEHFNLLLNDVGDVSLETISQIPQKPKADWLDLEPDLGEIEKAISQLSDGKAPGVDMIPGEIFKHGGLLLKETLWKLILDVWREVEIPSDWRNASMITIFKKGDRSDCGNYRGISLLSIAGKVLARVILNRLILHLENGLLPETQCGFRSERSTVDMIFALRQVQEKCVEQNMPLYAVFIDFTKAFDTVSRSGLWIILEKSGCPKRFTDLIKQFHEGMTAQVNISGNTSESFPVNNGVKQGCVLAPSLFSIFLSAVLDHAYDDNNKGIYIQTRPGADLFNISQFKAKRKTRQQLVRDLMFADDTALIAHSLEDIQEVTTLFAQAAKTFGLRINMRKTEVLHQPSKLNTDPPGEVKIDGHRLENVTRFTYLGSTVSSDAKLEIELQSRMAKASANFGRLNERLWKNKDITTKVKCQVYRAVILSTLLYGAETWTIYRAQVHKLNTFMMKHLRYIMGVRWWHYRKNTDILEKAGLPSMYELLMQKNLRWAGHVARLDSNRLPKQILFSQLSTGCRNRGRPKLRYKDTVKRHLKAKDIDVDSWYTQAQDRTSWRSMIHKT